MSLKIETEQPYLLEIATKFVKEVWEPDISRPTLFQIKPNGKIECLVAAVPGGAELVNAMVSCALEGGSEEIAVAFESLMSRGAPENLEELFQRYGNLSNWPKELVKEGVIVVYQAKGGIPVQGMFLITDGELGDFEPLPANLPDIFPSNNRN
jgi:hypothetical protein